jgi:hypothetical protein
MWMAGRGAKATKAQISAGKALGKSFTVMRKAALKNSLKWKGRAKFGSGVVAGIALWAGYSLLEGTINEAVMDPNNPNPPPGNPFDLEDPRQLLNLPNKSAGAIMRDLVCVAGNAVTMFAGPVRVGIAFDLLCYAWDHIHQVQYQLLQALQT